MIHLGASAYLSKTVDVEELIKAVTTVWRSGFYMTGEVMDAIRTRPKYRITSSGLPDHASVDLTRRELEVLRLICQERSNTEIAERLFLSVRTVEGHRNNLLLKTGCRNTAGLVLFAVRNQLIDVPL